MVKIDVSRCIGCEICQNICPDGFEIIDRKAQIKNEKADCIEEAANACPRGAIILENQTEPTSDNSQNFPRGGGFGMGRGMGRGRGMGMGRGRGRGCGFGRGMGRR